MWLNKRNDAGRARKHLNKICSCGWWERKFPSCFFVSALGCRCTCALFSSSQHLHFTLGETHMSRRHFVHWTDNWHRARWPCSYWEIFILFSFPGCQILLRRQTCSYLHKHKASFGICAQRVSQHQLVTYAPVHLGSIYSLYILLYFQVITSIHSSALLTSFPIQSHSENIILSIMCMSSDVSGSALYYFYTFQMVWIHRWYFLKRRC